MERPCECPVKVFLGAESTLARMLNEATSSRLFTPFVLGGLLRNRAYGSDGLVNPLALRRADDQALGCKRIGKSAELTVTQPRLDPKWVPLVDHRLAGGHQMGVRLGRVCMGFTAPFVKMVRHTPHELDAITPLCKAAAWKICIIMRGCETFEVADEPCVMAS